MVTVEFLRECIAKFPLGKVGGKVSVMATELATGRYALRPKHGIKSRNRVLCHFAVDHTPHL